MKKFAVIFLLVATTVLGNATLARADDYAYMGTNTGDFGTLDLTSGAFSLLGNFGQTLAGMAALNSTLYGTTYQGGSLYQINPANGNLTFVGNSGITYDDFGATPSGLYGVSTSGNLYSINSSNGAATLLGSIGLTLSGFRSLSNNGATLYFTDSTNLYTLNTTTGAATLVGNMGGPGVGAMVFENGTLYAGADAPDIRVDTLNPVTGVATSGSAVTGTTGQFYALAPFPVPEPTTWACLAIGAIALAGFQIRRS